jgi:hypothetical protein
MIHSPNLAGDPWRPPDALYRRALEIFEAGRRATGLDGRATAEALNFLQRLSHCYSPADLAALHKQTPAMASAFDIRQNASAALRSTLEARLLAGEPPEQIAEKLAVPPGAVEAYQKVFFDIVDRRACVDYIMDRVIGRPGPQASEDEIEACVKKTIGYCFGPRALDGVLDPRLAADAAGPTAEPLAALGQGVQRRKAAILLWRLDTRDPAARRQLLQLAVQNLNADPKDEDGATSAIERHIHAMLTEIPWLTGRAARSALPEAIAEVDDRAAELRADELMLLAAGELPAEIIDEVTDFDLSSLRADRSAHGTPRPPAATGGAASTPPGV